jgi:deazaflavin-dependent oxidoreductase (nitroreductase family)
MEWLRGQAMDQEKLARLVLITQGRSSGEAETSVLAYQRVANQYLVVATNEDSQSKPDWYLNLKSDPLVQVELGEMSFFATASTPTGKARLKVWPSVDAIKGNDSYKIPRESTAVLLSPM